MSDAEIVKNFKLIQEQINELTQNLNTYAEALHKSNSDAIDDIVISMLNQNDTTTGGETNV